MPLDDLGAHDGEGPDGESLRPPPHPDDRLWRHPSELDLPVGRLASTGSGATGRVRLWGGLVLAGGAGAAFATAVLLAPGVRDRFAGTPIEGVTVSPTLSSPLLEGSEAAGLEALGDDLHATVTNMIDELAPTIVRVEGGAMTGSGFVIRPDGKVMTSAGLVAGEASDREPGTALLKVSFGDGQTVIGTLVGSDPLTDVAVLDLPDEGYAALVVADDIGTDHATAAAVIGATDEASEDTVNVTTGALTSSQWSLERENLPPLNGLMQLAAGSDPSARGGPVVNERGEVVGLTTWSSDDWSYATPIDVATKVANDLMTTGSSQHCWLGIEGKNAKGSMVVTNAVTAGVVVTHVAPDGPATSALRAGDVIVAIDGEPIPDMSSLITAMLLCNPGEPAAVTYHDGTTTQTVAITPQAQPDP